MTTHEKMIEKTLRKPTINLIMKTGIKFSKNYFKTFFSRS